jgi:hypothetical protein
VRLRPDHLCRRAPDSMRRIFAAAIALTAWFALGLQLYLIIDKATADGTSAWRALGNFFGFFTILTNLLVATVLSSVTWGRRSSWLASPVTQSGAAIYIAVVGITYSLLLRKLWNPENFQKVADVILHDLVPIAYLLFWIFFVPKAGLRWKHSLLWLSYPVAYFAYIMVRGAVVGWYPYPFIDAGALGYSRALINALILLVGFLVLGLFAVACGTEGRSLRNRDLAR